MTFSSRSIRLLILPLLLALGLWAVATTTTEAAPNAQSSGSTSCALYVDGAFSAFDAADSTICALAIAAQAPPVNGYAFGRWGRAYLAIDRDGNAYASQGRGWQFWRTLELPAVGTEGDVDGDGIANEVDQCLDSAENYNGVFDTDGCPDTISTLLNFAADDLNQYWDDEFAEATLTYRPVTRISSYTSPSRRSSSYNAYYSSYGHRIAYDLRLMGDALTSLGDTAPVFILAHEFGHAVQAQLGRLGYRDTIYSELEADCLAGAYMQNLDERGMLEAGDMEEAMRQAYRVGDYLPHDHEGAHGSPTQRASAFELGFTEGPDICLTSYNP